MCFCAPCPINVLASSRHFLGCQKVAFMEDVTWDKCPQSRGWALQFSSLWSWYHNSSSFWCLQKRFVYSFILTPFFNFIFFLIGRVSEGKLACHYQRWSSPCLSFEWYPSCRTAYCLLNVKFHTRQVTMDQRTQNLFWSRPTFPSYFLLFSHLPFVFPPLLWSAFLLSCQPGWHLFCMKWGLSICLFH